MLDATVLGRRQPVDVAGGRHGQGPTGGGPEGGGAAETTDSDSSDGWGNGWGQIWAYDSRTETLHLLFESPNRNVLDFLGNFSELMNGWKNTRAA